MQIDAIMDNGMDTGGAVDQLEFGMTVNLGEAGRVALAHTNVKDQTQTVTVMPTMQDWINTFQPNTPTTVGEEGMPNTPYAPGTDGMPERYTVTTGTGEDAMELQVEMIMVRAAKNDAALHQTGDNEGTLNTADTNTANVNTFLTAITRGVPAADGSDEYNIGDSCDADDATAATACIQVPVFVHRTGGEIVQGGADISGDNTNVHQPTISPVTETFYASAMMHPATGTGPTTGVENTPTTVGEEGTAAGFDDPPVPTTDTVITRGHKASHISAEFGLGGIAAVLGYTEHKVNNATSKTKTTFIGAKGSLGDTGLDWGAFSRTNKNADGTESKPWTVGLSKSLGGGAWTYIEHGNNGNSGTTSVALGVSF